MKLVCHSKGPVQNGLEYNCYVVNGKLFCTLTHDEGKKTHHNGVCVVTINDDTYNEKLTKIIEVEYYDTTRYVLFKCGMVDIKEDRGYKKDEYGFTLVNLKS